MFDFIKKKIKDSINVIQKKIVGEEKAEEAVKEKETNKPQKSVETHKATEHHNVAQKAVVVEKKKEKRHIISHKITESDIDEIYLGIKSALAENNVALSVLDDIHKDLKTELMGKEISVLNTRSEIEYAIKKSIESVLLSYPEEKFLSEVRSKKPYVLLLVGVNGSGKTTTLAKLANLLKKNGMNITVSASDTFRAASIEQLAIHCKNLGIDLVKHNYGADPAAVAFDAIKHAKNVNSDVVLIDTAGRSDINKNLIEELKKVKRVSKPDKTIFIGDALAGNDAVNQARIFDSEIGIDASILSKADVDKKGGAVLSIAHTTKKPVLFLGTGQGYDDLINFDIEKTAKFIMG